MAFWRGSLTEGAAVAARAPAGLLGPFLTFSHFSPSSGMWHREDSVQAYDPYSYAASNMARMFSGGTLAWMLWTWLKT